MSTYTRSTYDVYKNGIKIASKLKPIEVSKIVGCNSALINEYSKDGTKFQGTYSFVIAETVIHEAQIKRPKRKERINPVWMPQEWIDEWNKTIYRPKRMCEE